MFNITPNAAKRISVIISQKKDPNLKLRISVDGGGCSGFQYRYSFESEILPEDKVFQQDSAEVMIDPISLEFLNNSTLDYIETLGSAAFEIKNPNAAAKCGCGNSFSPALPK